MVNAYGIPNDEDASPMGAVDPNLDPSQGGAGNPNAAPSLADGGAIPDDGGDASPNTDVTDYSGAMDVVRQAMNYGREQHGLGGGRAPASRQPEPAGIPEEDDKSDEEEAPAYARGGTIASYDDGGAVDDETVIADQPIPEGSGLPVTFSPERERRSNPISEDLQAGRDSKPDAEQYGRPQVVDDPERPSPAMYASDDPVRPQPGYAGPPEGNPIQRGAKATEGFLADTFGRQGPIPDPGSMGAPDDRATPTDATAPKKGQYPIGEAIVGGAQQIISYLQRRSAMPEGQAKALEASVAPAAKGDPNAVTMLAAEAANKQGGEQAAFDYLQRNAKRYEAALSHARAAVEGTPQRPADLNAAAKSATMAFVSMPDATDVRFQANGQGVSAIVKSLDGRTPAQIYNMTPEQFGKLTDVGGAGQFDRVMSNGGLASTMKELGVQPGQVASSLGQMERRPTQFSAQSNNIGFPRVGMNAGNAYDGRPFAASQAADSDRSVQMGHDMTLLKASPQYKQLNPNWGVDAPKGAPTILRPLTKDEQAQRNKLDLQDRRNAGRLDAQQLRNEGKGPARDYMAEIKERARLKDEGDAQRQAHLDSRNAATNANRAAAVDARLKQIQASSANGQQRDQARVAGEMIRAEGGYNRLTKEQKPIVDQILTNTRPQQAPQPNAAAQPAQQPQAAQPAPVTVQSPADAKALAPGTVYMTPDGRKFTR